MARLSTTKPTQGKDKAGFPLFIHPANGGTWAKKITVNKRSRPVYFGPVSRDPDGSLALARWNEEKEYLLAGQTPPSRGGGVSTHGLALHELVNRFLAAKQMKLNAGELAQRTFDDLHATGQRIVKAFGRERLVDDIAPAAFDAYRAKVAKTWGPVALSNEVQRVRSIFKWGYDNGLVDKPVRFGSGFVKASATVLRKARAARGVLMFEPAEIRKLLGAASAQVKAMILLGLNCGFGNSDCGTLPLAAVDLKAGWIHYPRPKTGIDRRARLRPETTKAIKAAIATRPIAKDRADAGLMFITKYGAPWGKTSADNPISKEFVKLMAAAKVEPKGRGFYTLRRVFRTIADESRDQVAVNYIMGHVDASMAGVYRQRIGDDRLAAVVQHVHDWLYKKKSKPR